MLGAPAPSEELGAPLSTGSGADKLTTPTAGGPTPMSTVEVFEADRVEDAAFAVSFRRCQ